jgi:hypothetical protein
VTKVLVLFLSCLTVASGALARTLDDVMTSPTRPTMAEVEEILPEIANWPGVPVHGSQIANWFDKRVDIDSWLPKLLSNGPKMIAHFEKTYPGATWVFLGRDGLPWADLFEAYYTSIGQKDRVVRLGISKPSMENVSDETLMQLMRDHGLPVDRLDSEQPVVFLDSVSGGYGRQGRRLMAAIYADWVRKGKDPLLLLDKLDMIGLIVSTFKGYRDNDLQYKPLHQYLQGLLLIASGDTDGEELQHQLRILTYAQEPNQANEAGYTHFLGAWHESFEAIRRDRATGLTRATPGPPFPDEMKRSVLWIQKKIWEFVKSGDCHEQVQSWAKNLGIKFPAERPQRHDADPERLQKFREKISRRRGLTVNIDPLHPSPRAGVAPQAPPAPLLSEVLREQGAGIRDRDTLLELFNRQGKAARNEDWLSPAPPKTAMSDLQFLQKALKVKCADLLEAG